MLRPDVQSLNWLEFVQDILQLFHVQDLMRPLVIQSRLVILAIVWHELLCRATNRILNI